jgi:hypothetical protein
MSGGDARQLKKEKNGGHEEEDGQPYIKIVGRHRGATPNFCVIRLIEKKGYQIEVEPTKHTKNRTTKCTQTDGIQSIPFLSCKLCPVVSFFFSSSLWTFSGVSFLSAQLRLFSCVN